MSSRAPTVAIAALVLLSTLGSAPAAAVAAPAGGGAGSAANGTAAAGPSDADLASGESFWRGWDLAVDAGGILPDEGGDRTVEIWRVTEDGRLNQRVGSFTVGEDGTHVVETAGLVGRFVLRYGGAPVYVDGGRAYRSAPPDGSEVTVESAAFRLESQTLEFAWDDPTVYPGQAVTLTVRSNRARSVVAVSGASLAFEELAAVFPDSAFASDHDARADEDVLLLEVGRRTELRLNTSPLAPGRPTFTVDVVDTATTAAATPTVLATGEQRITSIERQEHVGDVVEAEVACGSCYVVVGGPGQGILDVLHLTDGDGDGQVDLRINTRYAGMVQSAPGYPSGLEAYTAPADDVRRYAAPATLESVSEALLTTTSTLGDLRGDLGLDADGRRRPLPAGELELTVTTSDFLLQRRGWGDRPPLGSDLVIRDETDVRTVTLEPRSLDGVSTLAAPGHAGFEATPDRLEAVAGPRDRVALGDRLVFRFDVSGVFGYLAATGVSVEGLADDREEGLAISLARLPADGDGAAEAVALERLAAEVAVDAEADRLYLVLRTGGPSPARLDAGRYRATLAVEGIAARHDEYSTFEGHDGYPYLAPGEVETAAGQVTLAPATATVAEPAPGAAAHVTEAGELPLRGTATVAPETRITVVASAVEYAWETRTATTVGADGTWTARLGLAEAPGQAFSVAVYRGQQHLVTGNYTVLPPAAQPSAGGNATGGGGDGEAGGGADNAAAGGEAAATGRTVAGIPLPDLGGLADLAVPVGGGIGGLAFVWGAWRLVIRRIIV